MLAATRCCLSPHSCAGTQHLTHPWYGRHHEFCCTGTPSLYLSIQVAPEYLSWHSSAALVVFKRNEVVRDSVEAPQQRIVLWVHRNAASCLFLCSWRDLIERTGLQEKLMHNFKNLLFMICITEESVKMTEGQLFYCNSASGWQTSNFLSSDMMLLTFAIFYNAKRAMFKFHTLHPQNERGCTEAQNAYKIESFPQSIMIGYDLRVTCSPLYHHLFI